MKITIKKCFLLVSLLLVAGLHANDLVSYADGPYHWGIDGHRSCVATVKANGLKVGDVLYFLPGQTAQFDMYIFTKEWNGSVGDTRHYWQIETKIVKAGGERNDTLYAPRDIFVISQEGVNRYTENENATVYVKIYRERWIYSGVYPFGHFNSSYPSESLAEYSFDVVFDGKGPTISNDVPQYFNTQTPVINVTAKDDACGVDLTRFTLTIDGKSPPSLTLSGNTLTASFASAPLSIGTHTISASVSDILGNSSTWTSSFTVDPVAPVISAMSLLQYYNTLVPPILFSITDAMSGIRTWNINEGATILASGNSSVTSRSLGRTFAEGNHTLSVYASDYAVNNSTAAWSFMVDVTSPAINFSGPLYSNAASVIAGIEITENGSGIDFGSGSARYWIGTDAAQLMGGSSASIALTQAGLYDIGVEAADRAGNVSTASRAVIVDRTHPTIAFSGPLYSKEASSTTAMTVADDLAGFDFAAGTTRYRVDSGPWTALIANNASTSVSSEGAHLVVVEAVDQAGNTATAARKVIMDRRPPYLQNLNEVGTGWVSASFPVALSLNDANPNASIEASGIDPAALWYSLTVPESSVEGTRVPIPASAYDEINGRLNFTVDISGASLSSMDLWVGIADRAGNGFSQKRLINLDTILPTLSASLGEYAKKGEIILNSLTVSDAPSGVKAMQCAIDTGTFVALPGWSAVSAPSSIPLASLPGAPFGEGAHALRLRAIDQAGNYRDWNGTFNLDLTPPVAILAKVSRADGATIDQGDYAGSSDIRLEMSSTGSNGAIGWSAAVHAEEGAALSFPADPQSASTVFAVNLGNVTGGSVWVSVAAYDAAGNISPPVRRKILYDASSPYAPILKSQSHPKAAKPEDATNKKDVFFSICQSSDSGPSGVASFTARLWTAVQENGVVSAVEPVSASVTLANGQAGALVQYYDLPDNGKDASQRDEYYLLVVSAVGGNGKIGAESRYAFRIDSTPPTDIRIMAEPQVDPDEWNASTTAKLTWNRPADMTGVKAYKYIVTADPEWTLPGYAAGDPAPVLLGWKSMTDSSDWVSVSGIDLKDAAGGANVAILHVGVCAEDYAGNMEFGETTIRFDAEKPVFGVLDTNGSPSASLEAEGETGLKLTWAGASDGDNGSGLSQYRITLESLDTDHESSSARYTLRRTTVVAGAAAEADRVIRYGELAEDKVYRCLVFAVDGAGNEAKASAVATLGEASVPPEIVESYSETIGPYALSGKRRISSDGTPHPDFDVAIGLPKTIGITKTVDGSGVQAIESVALDDASIEMDADGSFQSGTGSTGAYTVGSGGFDLEATALSFTRSGGLGMDSASLDVMAAEGEAKSLSLSSVRLGFPPVTGLSSAASAISPALSARIRYLDGSTMREGLIFRSAAGARLDQDRVRFSGDSLDVDLSGLAAKAVTLSYPPETEARAKLSNLSLLSDFTKAEGDIIASGLELEMGSARYMVNRAVLRGNTILVLSATMATDPGIFIEIRNVGIDCASGDVMARTDFAVIADGLLGSDGEDLDEGELRFSLGRDGRIWVSGAVSTSYGPLAFTGLQLTQTGLDWSGEGGIVAGFTVRVHGFDIKVGSARILATGLRIDSGTIAFMSREWNLSGLLIGKTKDPQGGYPVLAAGTGDGANGAIDTGYGNPVALTSFTVDAEGLFLDVAVPVEGSIFPDASHGMGGRYYSFTRLGYGSDRSFGASRTLTGGGSGIRVVAGGYAGTAAGIGFDGTRIAIMDLNASDLPVTPSSIVFSGAGFSYGSDGAAAFADGSSATAAVFTRDGWRLDYAEPRIGSSGLGGAAELDLPDAFGQGTVSFPDAWIAADGGFASGEAAIDASLFVHGWELFLQHASLTDQDGSGLRLVADKAVLSLESLTAGVGLTFDNGATFGADGKILSMQPSAAGNSFLSANGYRVTPSSCTINDEGIFFSGAIACSSWRDGTDGEGPKASYSSAAMRLDSNGTVSGPTVNERIEYEALGFNLVATSVAFGKETVDSRGNSITWKGTNVSLGKIGYYADGGIAEEGISEQSCQLPVFGTDSTIKIDFTAISACFSEDGLDLEAFVSLPEDLGGYSLYFDRVTLNPDGTFSYEGTIERFAFELEGFRLELEDIWLSSEGLRVGYGLMTLPEQLESKQLEIRDFSIMANGDFGLGGARMDPFTLWGMYFEINDLSVVDGLVSFQGAVGLPEAAPGQLSGRLVRINEFKITTAGVVQSFNVQVDGSFTLPLMDSWSLQVNEIGSAFADGKLYFTMGAATLIFPPGFNNVQSASVNGIRYNVTDCAFDFRGMSAAVNIPMEYSGINFTLTELHFINADSFADMRFGFKGNAKIYKESGLPEFLIYDPAKGNQFNVDDFEILGSGKVAKVSINVSGLNGKAVGVIDVKDGAVSLVINSNENQLDLQVSGGLVFNNEAEEGLRGKGLILDSFYLSGGRIKEFQAHSNPMEFDLEGLKVQARKISLGWNEPNQVGTIGVVGAIALPSDMPGILSNATVALEQLEFDTTGAFQPIIASFRTEQDREFPAFGDINLRNIVLRVNLDVPNKYASFSTAGTLILAGDSFPEGIKGTEVVFGTVNSQGDVIGNDGLCFDTNGHLLDLNIAAVFPEQDIYGVLALKDGILSFSRKGSNGMVFGISGSLTVKKELAPELEGLTLAIREFKIDQNGVIQQGLDVGVSGKHLDFFSGNIAVDGASLSLSNGLEPRELYIDIGGGVSLSNQSLPASVRGASLKINTLRFSTLSGLKDFNIGLTEAASFPIYGKVVASVDKIEFSTGGMAFGASVTLPTEYGFKGSVVIALKTLRFDWNFNLLEISGGIAKASASLGGFDIEINDLMFSPGRIDMASCYLMLPANFKRTDTTASADKNRIGFKNAYYVAATGDFYGELDVEKIETTMGGFTIRLVKPELIISQRKLAFRQAVLVTPAFTGGATYILSGLDFSPSGLSISGATFSLPSFKLGNGLGFDGIRVGVSIYTQPVDGSYFVIEGGGKIMIPGLGSLSVEVCFTNPQPGIYPIGLEYANFSYNCSGPGLPLGSTGLYLNGIRGGISFGPLSNTRPPIPGAVQYLFPANGTRLQLGVTMVDSTAGRVLTADVDMWVDISNWSFAIQGDMTLMKGTLNLNASLLAALGKQGFYAGVTVQISFIRGQIQIYIFPRNGRTYFAGSGTVSFYIPQNFIKWGFIKLPKNPIEFGSIGTEFGTFIKDGSEQKGFKAYVSLPIIGGIGAFVSESKQLTLGKGITQISLIRPSGSMLSTKPLSSISENREMGKTPYILDMDRRSLGAPTGAGSYRFYVPTNAKASKSSGEKASVRRSYDSAGNGMRLSFGNAEDASEGVGAYERIIVACGYLDGAPSITLVSPSGKRYRPGDAGVETEYQDEGVAFAILSPEVGAWSAEVENPGSGGVEIQIFSKERVPSLAIDSPLMGTVEAQGSLHVSGSSNENAGTVRFYFSQAIGEYQGMEVAQSPVNEDGSFSVDVPTSGIPDGQYSLYAEYDRGSDYVNPKFMSPAIINVSRPAALLAAPTNFIAGETADGSVSLAWDGNNGQMAAGYRVDVRDPANGSVDERFVGDLLKVDLGGFEPGQTREFRVSAVDTGVNYGPATDWLSIAIGGSKPAINIPSVASPTIGVAAEIGSFVSSTLAVDVMNNVADESASGYLRAEIVSLPEGVQLTDENPIGKSIIVVMEGQKKVEGETMSFPFTIASGDSLTPGDYAIGGVVRNLMDPNASSAFTINLSLRYPTLSLSSASPERVNVESDAEVALTGSGFLPGLRAYYGETELSCVEKSLTPTEVTVSMPKGLSAGTRALRLVGPDGQEASISLEAFRPDWTGLLRVSSASGPAGTSFEYPIDIRGNDGFDGVIRFISGDIPAGWGFSATSAQPGGTAILAFASPGSALPGRYALEALSSDGKRINVSAVVTEGAATPEISGVSTSVAYPGQAITIYGSGFGSSGKAFLGETELAISSWSSGAITARLPDSAVTGMISVESGGTRSTGVGITILSRGFDLRSSENSIKLDIGQTKAIQIALIGSSDEVSLSASATGGLTASLSQASATPTATITLNVGAGEAPVGIYAVTVTAAAGTTSKAVSILVTVGTPLAIVKGSLPSAMEGQAYWARLSCEGATGQARYRILSGGLPTGFGMDENGVVSGKTDAKGAYDLRVEASDGNGASAQADVRLVVEASAWTQAAGGPGQSRSMDGDSPASDTIAWEGKALGSPKALISGAGRVWAWSESGIACLRGDSGEEAYRMVGTYAWAAYSGGTFWTLDSKGTLRAYDPVTGKLAFSRPGVAYAGTDGSRVIAAQNGSAILIGAGDGTLIGSIPYAYQAGDSILWKDGEPILARGASLYRLGESSPFFSGSAAIAQACADHDGYLVYDSEGMLSLLSPSGSIMTAKSYQMGSGARLALSKDAALLSDGARALCIERGDLSTRWEKGGAGAIAIGGGKAFLASANEVRALNILSGAAIWTSTGSESALGVSGGRLYAARANGKVECYSGADNANGPVTAISMSPAAPDGKDGWYVSAPEMSISSVDAETAVRSVKYRMDEGAWIDYEAPFALTDGDRTIYAYGVDTQGILGGTVSLRVRVDTEGPFVTATARDPEGKNGWYLKPVSVSLNGSDALSGLKTIEVSLDGKALGYYSKPVAILWPGEHKLSWTAIDNAGNQTKGDMEIKLDLMEPDASAKIETEAGIALISLIGRDEASGAETIEYKLDDGDALKYGGPFSCITDGRHTLSYRAIDGAGREGAWKSQRFAVRRERPHDGVAAWPEAGGERRGITRPAHEGMSLWAEERAHEKPGRERRRPDARIRNLPKELWGADYAAWKESDKEIESEPFGSLWVKDDAIVFMLIHKDSGADLSGWIALKEGVAVNEEYFPGGGKLYARRAAAGSKVEIPGIKNAGKACAPLVFAQELKPVSVEIKDPHRFEKLSPGESVEIEAQTGFSIEPLSLKYSFLMDGTETALPGPTFEAPWTERNDWITLRVAAFYPDGTEAGRTEKRILIENRSRAEMRRPAMGERLRAGKSYRLECQLYGADGKPIPAEGAAWKETTDGKTWKTVQLMDGSWSAPKDSHLVSLKVEWDDGTGHEASSVFAYGVSK